MKSVIYWYQFFTAREELVPVLHVVKFTKCEICGSTEVSSFSWCLGLAALFYCGTSWAFHIIIFLFLNQQKRKKFSTKECARREGPSGDR